MLFIPYADSHGQMQHVLGLGWSLNFEMFFYLVLGQGLWWRSRLWPAIVVSVLLAPLWLASLWLPASQLKEALPVDLGLLTSPILGYFLVGVVLAYLSPLIERRKFIPWPGVKTVVVSPALGIIGLVPQAIAQPLLIPLTDWAAGALAAVSVLWCTMQPNFVIPLNASTELAKEFGDASYSTYLSHSLLVGPAAATLAWILRSAQLSNIFIVMLCLLLLPFFNAVGLFVHRNIDLSRTAKCTAWLLPRPPSRRPSTVSNRED